MGKESFEYQAPWAGSVEASLEAAFLALAEEIVAVGGLDEFYDEDPEAANFIESIRTIGDEVACNVSVALTAAELEAAFGTREPNEGDLEAGAEALESLSAILGRGESRHVVLYEDGAPSAVFFFGSSLD